MIRWPLDTDHTSLQERGHAILRLTGGRGPAGLGSPAWRN